ncbi:hypothetical protein FB451DRAFT_1179041 [Mycena latifolia]|nr:hypothetical protein FB451DRAFT_1179041 [Mycena latifolia]
MGERELGANISEHKRTHEETHYEETHYEVKPSRWRQNENLSVSYAIRSKMIMVTKVKLFRKNLGVNARHIWTLQQKDARASKRYLGATRLDNFCKDIDFGQDGKNEELDKSNEPKAQAVEGTTLSFVDLHLPEAAAQRRNDHFDGNYWLPGQHWYRRLQKDRYGSVRGASSFIFTTRSNSFALRRSLNQDKESLLHGRSLAHQALLLDIYCKPDSANIGKWRQGLQNWDARYIMQEFAWKLNWIHFIQPRMVKISMEGGGHQRLLPWRRIFSVNESSGLGAPAKGEVWKLAPVRKHTQPA